MRSVQEAITGIRALLSQVTQQRAQAEELDKQVREREGKLAEQIKGGATTGDTILDFCIVNYGVGEESDRSTRLYHNLQTEVSLHNGEFVLVVAKKIDPPSFSSVKSHYPRIEAAFVSTELRLGVLQDGALVLDLVQGASFPTVNQVVWSEGTSNPQTLSFSLRADREFVCDHNQLLELPPGTYFIPSAEGKAPHLRLEVKIGDEEIAEWLAAQSEEYRFAFWRMTQLCGRQMTHALALAGELERLREATRTRLAALVQDVDGLLGVLLQNPATAHERLTAYRSNAQEQCAIARDLGIGNEQAVTQLTQKFGLVFP